MGDAIEAAERVRVVVRVRPQSDRELQQNSPHHTLTIDGNGGQVLVCKRKSENEIDRELRYAYDRVFDEKSDQADVFDYLRDGVQQVAQGFNCTIFAYGQTGTGKTHTMLGKDLEHHLAMTTACPETPEYSQSWGVIPRAIESLFEELQSISCHGSAGVVHCSYMQIYNNDVYDLLQNNKQRMKDPLAVREMIKGNGKQIYVSGLSEFRVTSLQETLQLLKTGNRNRTIRATSYNEKSSRSHALLQLSIEVESRGLESAATIIRRAKLNLVDLAGSEKWDTEVVTGSDRSKELTSINQSLSALGNVISALVNPKRTHIPYRDSKLTRLLQDSLGGNTRTVVIATISPSESAIDETISTLQFADRAKCVTVRVKVNEL
ncbi:Kinesin-like protein, partial [Phytophthora palmivora]